MPTIIPIPVHSSGSGELTAQDMKVMIGILIVLSIIFLITTSRKILSFIADRKRGYRTSFISHYFDPEDFGDGYNWLMLFVYAVVLLIWAGCEIAKFL